MKKLLPLILLFIAAVFGVCKLDKFGGELNNNPKQPEMFSLDYPADFSPEQESLRQLLESASSQYNIPSCALTAIAWIEGNHMWGFSNDQVDIYAQEGNQDPVNCSANSAGASGPMQFTAGQWNRYKDASGRSAPNICNIKDAIYATAAKLANDSDSSPPESNTCPAQYTGVYHAACHYYGECRPCNPTNPSFACNRLGGNNYCDFVKNYCEGNFTALPPNTPIYAQAAAQHPDINLQIRGFAEFPNYSSTSPNDKSLISGYHPPPLNDNGRGPQLDTLIINNPQPAITSLWQVHHWNWQTNSRDDLITRENYGDNTLPNQNLATLVGFGTTAGTDILVPESGYQISTDREVLVLYADADSITLKYTAEDDMVAGYGLHVLDINVDPAILNLYNQLDSEGRNQLPALCAGEKIGTAKGSEVRVAIRDTGSFMDPRWENDWWLPINGATPSSCAPIPFTLLEPAEAITISGYGHVCSDFIEKRDDTTKTTQNVLFPGSSSSNSVRVPLNPMPGTISLISVKFPDFYYATSMLVQSLIRTLPTQFAKNFTASNNLPGETTMYFKNFVQGQNEAGNFDPSSTTKCDQTPEAEVKVPAGLWGKMTGAIRGLCIYFGYCQPVEKYEFKLPATDYSCNVGSCLPGQEAKEVKLSVANNKAGFNVNNWATQTRSVNYSGDIPPFEEVTKTETHKEAKVLSRSQLAGVPDTAYNASDLFRRRLSNEIYNEVLPQDQAKALTEGFRYDVQFSPVESGEHIGEYYQLRTIRNLYCMNLCTLYSADKVPEIDPLCPSCNPKDLAYQDPPREPIPEPDNLPDGCHWDPYAGCDYYDCTYDKSKGQGPKDCNACFCEEGPGSVIVKCLTTALNLCQDINVTCPGERCCTDGSNYCERKFFEPSSTFYPDNPDLPKSGPPYGRCYYKNPDVCIDPKEWNDSSGCGEVCNNSCPGC